MDTLSQSELLSQYKKCLKCLSKKNGNKYAYVREMNDWIGTAYVKYVKDYHFANDPYDYMLHNANEFGDEETYDYISGQIQREKFTTMEELIEHEVNEMITLDINEDEHWIRL